MAQTLSGSTSPEVKRFTLSSTANNVTKVNLPDMPGVVSFYAASEAYWQPSGTDGSAADSSAKAPILAGSWQAWRFNGGRSIYIGSASSSADVAVAWERV